MTRVAANNFGSAKELSCVRELFRSRKTAKEEANAALEFWSTGSFGIAPGVGDADEGKEVLGWETKPAGEGASASIIYSLLWTATFFVVSSVSAAAVTSQQRGRGRSCPTSTSAASAGATFTRLPSPVRLRSAAFFFSLFPFPVRVGAYTDFSGLGVDFSGWRAGLRVGHPCSTSRLMVLARTSGCLPFLPSLFPPLSLLPISPSLLVLLMKPLGFLFYKSGPYFPSCILPPLRLSLFAVYTLQYPSLPLYSFAAIAAVP
ncbi:hypothetical protein K438DRAFT_1117454 [Mycena galopus ATCC 62051]|nr:hypothetical protein K438DRAFT_1117454 [Mycena galopus ATCC 62051]